MKGVDSPLVVDSPPHSLLQCLCKVVGAGLVEKCAGSR